MSQNFGAVLGKQSGKIGPIVGRIVNGKQFYAARPSSRKNKELSPKEKDARLKFSVLGRLGRAFRNASKLGLSGYIKAAPYRNPVSAFSKKNTDSVHCADGIAEIEFGSIICAEGILPQVGFSAANFDEPLQVSVAFSPNSDVPDADADDDIYLFVLEPESNQGILSAPVKRSTASIDMHLPSTWSGLTVHVYGFAVAGGRNNQGLTSNSAYIGTGNVG